MAAEEFTLRAIAGSDWRIEAELSSDPDVLRWTFHPAHMDEDAARERIRHYERRSAEGATQRFVILDGSDRVLGTCGLGRLQEEAPEVFYALTPWGRGRGAATWAVLALVGWAVDHGRRWVRLRIIDGNVASEKVAARAGFSPRERVEEEHRGRTVTLTEWSLDTRVVEGGR
ncbi:GNAT family N-acetyltransferase [Nocardioides campestrisoli]|uniref:GNAT family N-acetyltransferase n=1 Tax=Nocardioides campestrisoli TaxID=2736757 RepID=UPI00163D68FF|nr:GNAT family N-acetyltransferase [Nocardioides campestrisoli]